MLGILLSGMSISTITIFILNIYEIEICFFKGFEINDTFLFLIVSYLLGIIFQEVGSFIEHKLLNKNNRILNSVLNTIQVSDATISKSEKEIVYKYVEEKLNLDSSQDNAYTIYNFCKFNISNKDIPNQMKSASALSRSLTVYFFYFISICSI